MDGKQTEKSVLEKTREDFLKGILTEGEALAFGLIDVVDTGKMILTDDRTVRSSVAF